MNSKRLKLLAGVFLVFLLSAGTQAASYYRTNDSTGVVWNWSDAAKWQVSPDGSTGWTTATEAPNAKNSAGIEILSGANVLVDISDSSGQATVASDGTVKINDGARISTAGNGIIISSTDGDITNSGTISASSATTAGEINLNSVFVNNINGAIISANGQNGGKINITATQFINSACLTVDGEQTAGEISINTENAFLMGSGTLSANSNLGAGGKITITADGRMINSATITANGKTGGEINLLAKNIIMTAANINANGQTGGGRIRIGGEWQGRDGYLHSDSTYINEYCKISANATDTDDGGTINVWSDINTNYSGNISLYPKNRIVADTIPGPIYITAPYKTPAGGNSNSTSFGQDRSMTVLYSAAGVANAGNIVIADPNYSITGQTSVGAVYLYDKNTNGLLATLTGSTASDYVGSVGVTALTNGNYVVISSNWSSTNYGAATWGNGTTGISGTVSSSNSLVGSFGNDFVGMGGVTALTNGNYVVCSHAWSLFKGAATWGNGTTGTIGEVSAANSLVGSTGGDQVAYDGVTALTNGNYVVSSHMWINAGVANAGAATWGNGTTGTIGEVSAANSLVGSRTDDQIGSGRITALSNGNYVVDSYNWNNDIVAANAGAVTWGNGASGTIDTVASGNSLIGSTVGDSVGLGGVTALSNGNYVVCSYLWGANDVGAATWGNGASGTIDTVASGNSLIGSTATDQVGNGGATALTNGNYVVCSYLWGANDVGAATWGNGASGTTGTVGSGNSLAGATPSDRVGNGGATALSNGNYVVSSYNWKNAGVANAGAATWGNGATGTTGTVGTGNSLVGTTASDFVGLGGVTILSNGNYVVCSPRWSSYIGAATWMNCTNGKTKEDAFGAVSAANSLVGSNGNDQVGRSGVVPLMDGKYLVCSKLWTGDGSTGLGAFTPSAADGSTVGAVSSANSIAGTGANAWTSPDITSNVVYNRTLDKIYIGFTAQMRVAVVAIQITVTGVAVKTPPTKVTYIAGETLDLAGLVVTLTKSDASTQDVAFADFAANGITTNKVNGAVLEVTDTSVVITVNGQTTSQAITVNAVSITGVAVKTPPAKVTYDAGETLDLTGLVVTLTKSDASTQDVAFSDFAANGITTVKANGDVLAATDTAVVITVNGQTASQAITVTGVACGKIYTLKISEIQWPSPAQTLANFAKKPTVYATYMAGGKSKKTALNVAKKIEKGKPVASVECEWLGKIALLDKKIWTADKTKTTAEILAASPPSPLVCSVFVSGSDSSVPAVKVKGIDTGIDLSLQPPEITGVNPATASFGENVKVVISGKMFGKNIPAAWLEYKNDKGDVKQLKLKVDKNSLAVNGVDAKGKPSAMNIQTGDSEITVFMPKKAPKNWQSGAHNIVIDNKVCRATIQFQTGE